MSGSDSKGLHVALNMLHGSTGWTCSQMGTSLVFNLRFFIVIPLQMIKIWTDLSDEQWFQGKKHFHWHVRVSIACDGRQLVKRARENAMVTNEPIWCTQSIYILEAVLGKPQAWKSQQLCCWSQEVGPLHHWRFPWHKLAVLLLCSKLIWWIYYVIDDNNK